MVNPRTPRGTGEDRQKPCLLIGTQAATARCQRRAKSTPAIIVFLFYLQSACLRLPLPYCLLPSGKVQRRCRIDGGAILDPGRLHVAHKTTCRRSRFPQGGPTPPPPPENRGTPNSQLSRKTELRCSSCSIGPGKS